MSARLSSLRLVAGLARPQGRAWRHSRPSIIEELEKRVLLSGSPTVYTVNATTANGAGSGNSGDLVYVINQANANTNPAGSVIDFSPSVFNAATPQTITLSSALDLSETTGPEVVDGPGASAVTVSGNYTVSVFDIAMGVTASLSGLTISRGWGAGNAFIPGKGGGVDNSGTLTITNCSITNDAGTSLGGVCNSGTMMIVDSTIANDFANAQGLPFEEAFGGGIDNAGTLTISGSTIANDSAYSGGGIYNVGALSIANSTIADNESETGGGIENYGGTLTVINSTIAGNNAYQGSGVDSEGTLTSVNCTIVYNLGTGGGLAVGSGTAILDNTIVALNSSLGTQSGSVPYDIIGTVSSSSSHNLIGTGGSGGLQNRVNGNHVGVAKPLLGTLADNGGLTHTISLLRGSPAIGAGSVALAVNPITNEPLATDQRGAGFARVVNGKVDIGALESAATYTNTEPPTVASERVLTAGKGGHSRVKGFELTFSEALKSSRARDSSNYIVIQTLPQGWQTVSQRVKLKAEYSNASHSVSLILSGRPTFALGGELTVIATAPSGITSAQGVYLDGSGNGVPGSNAVFVILPERQGLAD